MQRADVLIVGGGISGVALAAHAARAGARAVLVEREARLGGALASERVPDDMWFELGAHTAYNSYGAFLDLLEASQALGRLRPRAKPVLRFLEGDRVRPGSNLRALVGLTRKLEFLRCVPRWRGADPTGKSVREHYAVLVGERNYERYLGALLSAVPSQTADDLPADMLFKKRPRRKDVLRSFTLEGGLRTAVDAIADSARFDRVTGRGARALERVPAGWVVELDDGSRLLADALGLAVGPEECARLLRTVLPELSARVGEIGEASVDSIGFCARRERVPAPRATFFIPLRDSFFSIVTRDVVPHPRWRAFTAHFRPGLDRAERLARACRALGIEPSDAEHVRERRTRLPAPRVGHARRIEAIDASLGDARLALVGNWFSGLSIEDCALRARAEWERLAAER